jgi:PhnB protein
MKAVNITLTFNGQAEAAFNFYKSVFGGEFIHLQRLKEMPTPHPLSEEEGEKVLHVALPVGSQVLAGMDVPSGLPQSNRGDNFMITLDTESEEETSKLFEALSDGGFVMMALEHQFWGAYFGMLTDKFGIQWMLSYVKQD